MAGEIKYTGAQREVINSNDKRLLVLSCAGSGKTSTIVGRILRLIKDNVLPQAILVLSFSNKSVQDLHAKLRAEAITSDVKVQTFHSFGLEFIKKYSSGLDLECRITIINDTDRKKLVKELCEKIGLFGQDVDECSKYIRTKKNYDYKTDLAKRYDAVFGEYNKRLREMKMIDMEDLIYLPIELINTDSNVANEIKGMYQYVFVDEYQDTNEAQNRLLDAIIRDDTCVCLVGDDDQSIYEWRGAKPQYIRDKASDSSGYTTVKLEKNFRSQKAIIDVAYQVISHNHNRVDKKITAELPAGQLPVYTRLKNEQAEAQYVADRIVHLHGSKRFRYSDIAILCRNEGQMPAIEFALKDRKIPYEVNEADKGMGYSKFIAVLKAIDEWNKYETIAAAVNFPTPCFDKYVFQDAKETYNKETGNTKNYSPLEWLDIIYMSSVNYDEDCETFRNRYRILTQLRMAKDWSAKQAIAYLMEQYYPAYDEKDTSRKLSPELQYLRQAFDIACVFEENEGPQKLSVFINQLSQVIDLQDYNISSDSDAVTLMTMHRSKGLEYKVVFIVGIQVGIFPNDYFIDGKMRIEESEKDLEAERRLFYVAITRARDLLFLSSYGDPYAGSSKSDSVIKHGFMTEISRNLISFLPFDTKILDRYAELSEPQKKKNSVAEAQATLDSVINEDEKQQVLHDVAQVKDGKIVVKFTDLSEEMLKEYRSQAYELAIQQQYQLPDDVFIVVIGNSDLNDQQLKGIIKSSGFKNVEIYDYEGRKFNVNRLFNNTRCIGIIMGPMAHKLPTVGERSLKDLLKQGGYPYTVDLINLHITKTSLKEALTKIKWNYFRTNGDAIDIAG